MSNAARKQLGLDSELPNKHKNEHLPLHDLHILILDQRGTLNP